MSNKHWEAFPVLLCILIGGVLGLFCARKKEPTPKPPVEIPKFVLQIPAEPQSPDSDLALAAGGDGRLQNVCRENLSTSDSPQEKCVWAFHAYEPSAWEEEWRAGEESGARRNRECDILVQDEECRRSRQLIQAIQGVILESKAVPRESLQLFSRMVYARRCGPQFRDTGERRVQLIESLVGLLRDPLTICSALEKDAAALPFDFGENAEQAKRHLPIGPAAPWTGTPSNHSFWHLGGFEPWAIDSRNCAEPPTRQNMLVDMGASLYGIWKNDPNAVGALWFVDRYQRRGLSFDRVVSYEIEKHDPDTIYRNVPDELLPRYIYYKQGIEAPPNG